MMMNENDEKIELFENMPVRKAVMKLSVRLYGLAYAQTVSEIILAIAAVITLASLFKKLKAENQNSSN